jgi:hypothetical protein
MYCYVLTKILKSVLRTRNVNYSDLILTHYIPVQDYYIIPHTFL